MRTRTLMWNTFMTRGQNKCIIMAQYKGKEEDAYIPPNSFEKTYEELGIHSGCQITLIEFRKKLEDSSDDEGGEDDMEEMEAEVEEEEEDQPAGEGEGDAEEKPEGEAAEEEKPEAEEKDDADGEAAKEGGNASGDQNPVQADAPAEASAPAGERPTAAQQLDMP